MNKKLFLILLLVACSTAPQAQLTPYPGIDDNTIRPIVFTVNVNMVEQNMYVSIPDNVYIQTKDCYETANAESAVLVYQQYGYSNRLDFASGNVCKVINLMYNPND